MFDKTSTVWGKYGIDAVHSFLGAASGRAMESKEWVSELSLLKVVKLSVGTEEYFKKACMNPMHIAQEELDFLF